MKIPHFPMPGDAYLPALANQQYHWVLEELIDEHPKITSTMDRDYIKMCCYHIVNSKIFNDAIGEEVGYERSYSRKINVIITDTHVGIYVGLSCYDTDAVQEVLCYDHIAMQLDFNKNDNNLYLMRFDTGEDNDHDNPKVIIKPISALRNMLFDIPNEQLTLQIA